MRLSGLVGLVLAGGVGLLAACSGADTQAVLTGSPSTSSTTSGGTTSGGTTSGGTTSGGTTSGGTTSGGSLSCSNGENEPNDEQAQANFFSGTICGVISPQGDVDWITFTLKPTTQTLAFQFSGRVRLRITVEGGGTTEITPDDAGKVPFVRGKPYYVEVAAYTDSESDQEWRVTVVEK